MNKSFQIKRTFEYRILPSLRDELNQGWVWVSNLGFGPRSIVKITNKTTKMSIYCECLAIDDNYTFIYNKLPRENIDKNEPTIIVNDWYRKGLGGITTKTNQELEIRAANDCLGKLLANLQHPQVIVRMATGLAIISVALGFLGAGLGAFSIYVSLK